MAEARTRAGAAPRQSKASKRGRAGAGADPLRHGPAWFGLTLLVVGLALAVRLAVVLAEPVPIHFDEAQYWAYGQALDWGYFSKPPGVAAAIRLETEALGQHLWAVRLFSPLCHALVAWMLFLTGARIWDGRTGFWAATGYTLGPGVAFSALLATTDPLMMAGWAVGLYALVRALQAGGLGWWIGMGVAVGLAMLTKYTAAVFLVSAAGFLLFSAGTDVRRDWRGFGIGAGVALAILMPNVIWNAANGFATFAHVAEDADPGKGYVNPGAFLEFTGAQLAVIGPPFFLALFPALFAIGRWREDWGMRLLAWQTWAMLGPILVLAFLTRANGNWAAPAYIGGSLMVAKWLLVAGWRRWLIAQVAIGLTVATILYAGVGLYAIRAVDLPAGGDPFRKTRVGPAFCARALGAMADRGATVLLSTSRHRLSECMWYGGLGWDDIAVWNPDLVPSNHHQLVSTLREGDGRRMILATDREAGAIVRRFARAERIDAGRIRTHADRAGSYELWVVQGFEGYDADH